MQQISFKPLTTKNLGKVKNDTIKKDNFSLNYLKNDTFKKEKIKLSPQNKINFTSSKILANQNLYFKDIDDDTIEVSQVTKDGIIKAKMPKYLYHLTSRNSFNEISKSGVILPSKNEQLKAVYLIDKDNFIDFYSESEIDGTTYDLMGSLLLQAQANRDNFQEQFTGQYVLIKLPTKELLKKDDIRIRKQEDYFHFAQAFRNFKEGLNINELNSEDLKEIKSEIEDEKIMDKEKSKQFFKDFSKQIQNGYSIFEATENNLKNKGAIEYAFKSPVKLDEFKDLKVIYFNEYEFFKGCFYDFDQIRRFFSGIFDEDYC